MACWAEPLASLMPDWAWLLTSSMRTSFFLTRSWVFSTSEESVSTFWLISPTSRPTYFLVAQPERATLAATRGTTNARIKPPFLRCRADERVAGRGQVRGT